jgi:FdhD protein
MSGRKSTKKIGFYEFIGEEPLSIRIEDKPYAVVMRTPGEEVAHAAGFCLAEGIVDSPDDFKTVGYDEQADPNVIDVWLKPERREQVREHLRRRVYTSQTSCGICGKEMIEDLKQIVTPLEDGFEIGIDRIQECIDKLSDAQQHYETTRSSHAALLLDDRLERVSFAEDVGRHNSLDKAIGKAFMGRKLSKARVAVLSSRNSYEMVQKAARARLPVMISESRTTALAVEMGMALNMTLVFPGKSELVIVCGEHRVNRG